MTYLGIDVAQLLPCRYFRTTAISRSGSAQGRGRSSTAFTTEKIAVLAPIPSARAASATRVKPGVFRRNRRPFLRSARRLSIPVEYVAVA